MPIDFSPLPRRLLILVLALDALIVAGAWAAVHLGYMERWFAIGLTVFNVVSGIVMLLQAWLQGPRPETPKESAP